MDGLNIELEIRKKKMKQIARYLFMLVDENLLLNLLPNHGNAEHGDHNSSLLAELACDEIFDLMAENEFHVNESVTKTFRKI